VRGADAVADDNASHATAVDAGHAVVSPGTVVLLDSTARGGMGAVLAWDGDGKGGCPPACPGGAGGDGVHCERLVRAGSTLAGGGGSQWFDELTVAACCTGPSGAPLIVLEDAPLCDDVHASGPARLGQPWSLSWSVPGGAALLFVSAGAGPAPQLGAQKLHLAPPLFLGVVLATPGSLATTVPADPALTGLEFALQLYGVQGWSRPVGGVLGP
jgi:hypothetical protein